MTNKTWFNAFFNAVTSSPEFKAVVENDYKEDMENAIKKMEKTVEKASKLPQKLQETFATKEAIETWESMKVNYYDEDFYKNQNYQEKTEKKWEKKIELNIKYPEKKNPETFGFLWVAGMQKLKQDLQDSFIAPLKFKFMVEKIKSDVEQEKSESKKSRKEQMQKKIYEVYKKFKVWIPTWMLFYWPPWTWKTFITKKLAEELWAGLIKKSVWEFGSEYHHKTTKT